MGPVGIPVAWRSEYWSDDADPGELRLHFLHRAGVTRGMRVTWHIRPARGGSRVTIEHDFVRRLPLLGPDFVPLVVDRLFVRPIAGRTLATFKQLAEATSVRERDREVWVTGLGMVTPIGTGLDRFWAGLQAGKSPVKRIDRFDPSAFRSQVAAQIDDFEPTDHMDAKAARQTDRFSHFALAAGRLAIADAQLDMGARNAPRGDRFAVYVGSALGGIAYAEEQHERYMERGIRSVAPNLALAVFGGAAPANVGIALGLHGPILSTANSCAAGAVAIGEAFRLIRSGGADAALAGGVEVPLSPLAFGAFDIIRALGAGHNDRPAEAARPFDAERDGFVIGEGAALLVLEAREVAREARRHPVRRAAWLRRHERRLPHGPAAARRRPGRARRATGACRRAHEGGRGRLRQRPRLVHAARRLRSRRVPSPARSEPRAKTVPVSGTKAYYGHPLGASGAIEASICALAIARGWAPGTVNLRDLDPEVSRYLPGVRAEPLEGKISRRALDLVRLRRPQRRARLQRIAR